jgi:RHS repeat-associated protein
MFTGKERDQESGLDYFGARYNSSSMGRFMSPDPGWFLQADLTNPQTWNQYSYVLNNPLRFIDPTGLECVWEDGSYDSIDDKQTGNAGGCRNQGGAWVGHDYFQNKNMADWSGSGNSDLSGIYTATTSNSTTMNVNANGSDNTRTTNYGYDPSRGAYFTTPNAYGKPTKFVFEV